MSPTESKQEPVCPHCGWPVDDGAKFCDECAGELSISDSAGAGATAEPVTEQPLASVSVDGGSTPAETSHAWVEDTPSLVTPAPAETVREAEPAPAAPFPSPAEEPLSDAEAPGLWDRVQKAIEDRIARVAPKSRTRPQLRRPLISATAQAWFSKWMPGACWWKICTARSRRE